MRENRAASAFAFLAALALAHTAAPGPSAAEVREVKLGTPQPWERGRLAGLAVSSDGALSLAPALRPLNLEGGAPPPYLLCQARDREGNLYVGASGPARVFRFTPHGNASLIFQGQELQVTALSLDSKGRLYVGTSPRGRVYRISAGGEAQPFFETEERYIWTLVVDGEDQVWVGTGERGRLFRVDGAGKDRLALDSPDPHITALALHADGSVAAGTDGRGLVYRVGREGAVRLLFEGGLRQVSALAVAPGGSLYAGLVAPSAPASIRERHRHKPEIDELGPARPFEREGPLPLGEQAPPLELEEALEPLAPRAPRSRIVQIDSGGAAREIWSVDGEWLHTLGLGADGALYFGTGDPARLYRLEGPDRAVLLARPEAGHLTSVQAGAGGRLTLLTGRPGWVLISGEGLAESGTAESEPLDAGTFARWGRVRWQAEAAPGARIEVMSRSGNNAYPDSSWSDWSAAYVDAGGSAIVSPPARYLQWKVLLNRGREPRSPLLRELTCTFLPANRPPRLDQVTLHGPGEYFVPDPSPELGRNGPPAPGLLRHRPGVRSLSWQASDADGDRLSASLRVRALGAPEWKSLAEGIEAAHYAWSVAGAEEGWHEVQVEISDQGSNPPESAGRAASAPQTFKVDVTPPRIEILREALGSEPPQLELRVRDALSAVRRVEVRADESPPRRLVPRDSLEDSMSEEYVWKGAGAVRRVRVVASDSEGNRVEWKWPAERPAGSF